MQQIKLTAQEEANLLLAEHQAKREARRTDREPFRRVRG